MDQYKKSGPKQETPVTSAPVQDTTRLEQLVKEQGDQIRQLDKELRRVKSKMDAHAATINKLNGQA